MANLKDCRFCAGTGRVIKNGSTLRADGYVGGFGISGGGDLPQIPCPACKGVGKVLASEVAIECGFCSGTGKGSRGPCPACEGTGIQVPRVI